MKKIVFSFALVMGAFALNAQNVIQGTKFGDNWALGLNVGAVTPLTHSAFFKNARPAFGLHLDKQLTPIVGATLQGMTYVNTSFSKTAFDASEVSALGRINLMNLFSAYNGTPRLFEIEAVAGIGWLHGYVNGTGDSNSWSTRMGLNLNFNLGEQKAWTLALKPALIYDMQGDMPQSASRFNANNAVFELTAGLTYHFVCSTGEHHLTKVQTYNQAEIDNLNASINSLRGELSNKNNQIGRDAQAIDDLKRALEECNNREIPVETVVETNSVRIPETIVTFKQGRVTIDASQLPNVERVASYMNKHPETTVTIKGYASPEGSVEVNERIAKQRAEAVQKILTTKYRIDAKRITAEGQGVGDMFSEPDWNRVSICTITDKTDNVE
ncbi:MAG: OmpA family protein [Prevotellaceae bacterium]|jgi:outer membrane protein OmpA-like peptidoglycan-associated protein|nr:OmpA family protein [Prevotellaceae bacterium]